jgi:hypothetical protein
MALVTQATDAGVDGSTGAFAPQIPDLIAGEDSTAGLTVIPCYIAAADGKVYMADGVAANEKAVLAGFAARSFKAGQPVTLFGIGTRFRYAAALTPGAKLFIGATAGRLDTAATTGDAVGVAQAISATDIRVTRAI